MQIFLPTVLLDARRTVWLGGVVVRALGLRLEIEGSNPIRCTVECDIGQVVHTHCPAPLKLRPYCTT